MADIFLSYAKEDVGWVNRLVGVLEQKGWSVWWDQKIPPGQSFDRVVEEEIEKAKCIVVLWSNMAVRSDWVKSEADEGKKRKILVPALIENVSIPLEFRRTQAAILYDWRGDLSHPELQTLLRSVEATLRRIPPHAGDAHTEVPHTPEIRAAGGLAPSPDAASPQRHRVSRLRNNPTTILLLCLLSVAVLAVALFFIFRFRFADTTKSNPVTIPPTVSFTPDMVLIPGGTFQMGRDKGPDIERPQHQVAVQEFYMDRTEVINLEYAAFVRDWKYKPPAYWYDNKPPPGQERWPVANVSFYDALAFAAWRSARDGVPYRLPTEEEWEYAARGGDQNLLYPWGNDWQDDYANVNSESPKPPCSYPKGNRWGVCDLLGNVWEWTSTNARPYFDPENPKPYLGFLVVRGGSFKSNETRTRAITAMTRFYAPAATTHPAYGFRLVRSP